MKFFEIYANAYQEGDTLEILIKKITSKMYGYMNLENNGVVATGEEQATNNDDNAG